MTDQSTPQFSTAEFEPTLVDSHPLFMRGLLFGAGGAILGLILYSTVGIVTGYSIGFVSLAVGWLVGKSIVMGSKGRTGRRYQVAAALLTYFAVSVSAVPIGISYAIKNPDVLKTENAAAPEAGAKVDVSDTQPPDDVAQLSLGSAIGALVVLGLTSPFYGLSDMSGLIGLIILFVGIQIAWQITGTRKIAVEAVLTQPTTPGENDKPTSLNLNR